MITSKYYKTGTNWRFTGSQRFGGSLTKSMPFCIEAFSSTFMAANPSASLWLSLPMGRYSWHEHTCQWCMPKILTNTTLLPWKAFEHLTLIDALYLDFLDISARGFGLKECDFIESFLFCLSRMVFLQVCRSKLPLPSFPLFCFVRSMPPKRMATHRWLPSSCETSADTSNGTNSSLNIISSGGCGPNCRH